MPPAILPELGTTERTTGEATKVNGEEEKAA
jgi:hypothetical protein